ncbi:MAG: tRNA (adenosine(37)-N6)-threonylcarbamoyltransferase complex ATPase subunit type 1 TsaE [Planctomycetota bacterium]|jgi:tRNA threonylcarbamoyladenosine biosynthesis protein TsaE
MERFTYHADDESATAALGAAMAEALPNGTVVGLCGTLGSGKTRLVQAVAEATGVDPRDVTSPTFVLVHEYQGRRPVYHLDAYRLRDDDEFLQLGPEEYFDSPGLTLIEWADRVKDCLPPDRIEVQIEVTGPESRRFEIVSIGDPYRTVVARMASQVATGDS